MEDRLVEGFLGRVGDFGSVLSDLGVFETGWLFDDLVEGVWIHDYDYKL